uniref:Uncharacterized protein n=1 Tax=Strongyloides papillosus TaxID=174720 RepID=A0A0N5C2M8_STREA
MRVFKTLTVFIIISISIIVKIYATQFYLSATGTPKCLFKTAPSSEERVKVQLGINGSDRRFQHKIGTCGESITVKGPFDSSVINSGKIYVNYTHTYKKIIKKVTYKIPDDCQTSGGYGSRRRSNNYYCNLKSYNDLLNEQFCNRFFGFITGCFTLY